MALIRYEQPFGLLNQLNREVNRLFSDGWNGSGLSPTDSFSGSDWIPAIDIKEEEKQFVIHADVPGVDPKDIEVTAENGILTIKGQREQANKDESENYSRMERVRGCFIRRFTLPDAADTDNIYAKTKDGVLNIVIPKGEKAQPKRISIES